MLHLLLLSTVPLVAAAVVWAAGGPKWMAALMDPTYDITWNILLFRGTRFLTRRAGRRWLFGKDSQEK